MQISPNLIHIFIDDSIKSSYLPSSQKIILLLLRMRLAFVFYIVFALVLGPLNLPLGYSQNQSSDLTHSPIQIPATLSDRLELPDIGFSIAFPRGWSGVNHGFISMVSPDGINQYNGNFKRDQNKAVLVIEILDINDYQQHNFTSKIQEECQIKSQKFVTFNNIVGKEVMIHCGSEGDQKIVNYIFGSGDKIVIVGLKGESAQFDNNLDAFKDSLNTLTIKIPIDIKQMPEMS